MGRSPLVDDPLVADLSRPENLPGAPARVEFLFTHGSFVFRTPTDVYKVKRAKDYGFFDYTTLEARKHYCEEELRLNRRTAPEVYLGLAPITRDARGHCVDGGSRGRPGPVVDWAVHMAALPEECSALALVRAGTLRPADISLAAERLARFYREAEPGPPDPTALAGNVAENFEQLRPFVGRFVPRPLFDELQGGQRAWLERHAHALAARPARDGHGDLRLEHLYLLPRGPVIIDCIEFLDRFRVADPALDVAFLAMDLAKEHRPDLAEHLFARFAYESDDYDFYPLADGYVAYRAVVRAKVACFVAADASTPAPIAARKADEAAALLDLARETNRPRRAPPRITAVGGMIASGKTTLAAAVAARDGLAYVSADATRKHLAGLSHEQRGGEALYTAGHTAATMDELLARAACALDSGRGVVLDTTFARRALRDRARALAAAHGAGFLLVECRVSAAVARARLAARKGGVSDAREDLLERFEAAWEPIDELPPAQHLVLDGGLPRDELLAAVPRA